MAKKVTQEDIEQMNELYLELHTYAAVSRAVGFSAGTVKKYIIPDYQSKNSLQVTAANPIPKLNEYKINFDIRLSKEEQIEIEELWEEILI